MARSHSGRGPGVVFVRIFALPGAQGFASLARMHANPAACALPEPA